MAHDLVYSGKRPPEPTEPGVCICQAGYDSNCPRDGQTPVLTPSQWEELPVIATRDPQETWHAARQLSQWARHPGLIRPVYVIDDGVYWVAALVQARNEDESWAEYTLATLGGVWLVVELPTRHLARSEWNEGMHRTVPLRTLRAQRQDWAQQLVHRIRHHH